MLFRILVLLGGACALLLAYHGDYWLSDWPWLFYYALVSWWFSFSCWDYNFFGGIMYLHLVPTLYHTISNKCRLESVTIPELEFEIKGDALSCGRPIPNKRLNVGMQKNRKAMVGLLVEYGKQVSHFTTQYKWYIGDIGFVQHNIKTIVLDCELDLISQYIGLNIGLDEFKPRLHPSYHKVAPVKIQPMM
ncbi:DUF6012 family protein (plasmid) [Klebsiella michiganensis]|uniref:DUF6012 family protein n=1 Tax=Klebsiella michiganensis TaxID=1134687 RepID=UPI0021DAF1C5|nr:DUF6012 family protein [Klebsiella michiganensis]UYB60141.1 DUF6012 family protein [Klebsiella michiganensis]